MCRSILRGYFTVTRDFSPQNKPARKKLCDLIMNDKTKQAYHFLDFYINKANRKLIDECVKLC